MPFSRSIKKRKNKSTNLKYSLKLCLLKLVRVNKILAWILERKLMVYFWLWFCWNMNLFVWKNWMIKLIDVSDMDEVGNAHDPTATCQTSILSIVHNKAYNCCMLRVSFWIFFLTFERWDVISKHCSELRLAFSQICWKH